MHLQDNGSRPGPACLNARRSFGCAMALIAVLGAVPTLAPAPAMAQEIGEIDPDQNVTLLADEVTYDTETGKLTATGSVEVYYGERTLTASKIIYDDRTKRITAEGDIVLRDPSGTTVYADIVELDSELQDGLVRGAQSLIGRQGKIAAVEGRRVEDRYNVLAKAVYSPCDVCSEEPTPLWRIRARKIIHDEEKKQIHYENAWFDLFGMPVLWTPYFRHPDPTVDRASGFLAPSFGNSSNYGYGAKVPYYWVIDEQSDITVSPFFTSDDSIIGQANYRRAFETGKIEVGGSVTRSDFNSEDGFDGHLDTTGAFTLGDGIKWGWDVTLASDDAYLRFFDFTNVDRLESEIYVFNYQEKGFFDGRFVRFQSLLDDEPAGTIPLALPDFDARYEFIAPNPIGGDIGVFGSTATLVRTNGDGLDINNGGDTTRISMGADWERQVILPVGLSLTGFAELRGDLFLTRDNPAADDDTALRFAPLAGVEARYPLIWEQTNSVAHVVEPIIQGIIAPFGGNGSGITNEDSLVTEFDETNLFDRTHFSGLDGFEEGPRLNVGIRYERLSNDGMRMDASVGRVLRLEDADEFSTGTGLANTASDWVGAWSVGLDPYVTFRQRFRFDDDLELNRNEIGLTTNYGRLSFDINYVFLEADAEIGEPLDREEVSAGARIKLDRNWSMRGFLQRDLELGSFVEAGGGFGFKNECCEIDLFVRRRFTDQEDVPASTSVGVQVKLLTLGSSDTDQFERFGRGLGSTNRERRAGLSSPDR